LAVFLPEIEETASRVSDYLAYLGLDKQAMRVTSCYGYRQCNSTFCPRCLSRFAYRERQHLELALPQLLRADPDCEFWMLTGATKDSPDIRAHAQAAVNGMRTLLKHECLKNRVLAIFGSLEIAYKGKDPCSHVHALICVWQLNLGHLWQLTLAHLRSCLDKMGGLER